jgi:peptidoglycan hydrolase-like protein with peptidoglycan-binding domain
MKQRIVVWGFASVLVLTVCVGCAHTPGSPASSRSGVSASGAIPAGSTTDPDRLRWAQRALLAAGFDPGAANGTITPGTVSAVQQFQRAQGLPATGYLNWPTEEALATASGIARPGGRSN